MRLQERAERDKTAFNSLKTIPLCILLLPFLLLILSLLSLLTSLFGGRRWRWVVDARVGPALHERLHCLDALQDGVGGGVDDVVEQHLR